MGCSSSKPAGGGGGKASSSPPHGTSLVKKVFHRRHKKKYVAPPASELADYAQYGFADKVDEILRHHPSAAKRHDQGPEALRQAMHNDYLEVARVLLRRGVCVDVKNTAGHSILTECCMTDDKAPFVSLLVSYGASPDQPELSGWTAIMHAAAEGRVETTKALLTAYSPEMRAEVERNVAESGGNCTASASAAGAAGGAAAAMPAYGAAGGLSPRTSISISGMDLAGAPGLGSDPNTNASANADTASLMAPRKGRRRRPKQTSIFGSLFDGALEGAFSSSAIGGGDADDDGEEEEEDEEERDCRLRLAAAVNLQTDSGWSALLLCINGSSGAARKTPTALLLLQAGADACLAERDGVMPLHCACFRGYGKIVHALLAGGGMGGLESRERSHENAPLHFAAMNGSTDCTQQLLSAGAQVGAANAMGWTALHYAAHLGYADLVTLLLAAGADCLRPALDRQTAHKLSRAAGHRGISEMLRVAQLAAQKRADGATSRVSLSSSSSSNPSSSAPPRASGGHDCSLLASLGGTQATEGPGAGAGPGEPGVFSGVNPMKLANLSRDQGGQAGQGGQGGKAGGERAKEGERGEKEGEQGDSIPAPTLLEGAGSEAGLPPSSSSSSSSPQAAARIAAAAASSQAAASAQATKEKNTNTSSNSSSKNTSNSSTSNVGRRVGAAATSFYSMIGLGNTTPPAPAAAGTATATGSGSGAGGGVGSGVGVGSATATQRRPPQHTPLPPAPHHVPPSPLSILTDLAAQSFSDSDVDTNSDRAAGGMLSPAAPANTTGSAGNANGAGASAGATTAGAITAGAGTGEGAGAGVGAGAVGAKAWGR